MCITYYQEWMPVHLRFICYIFAFVNPVIRDDLGTVGTYCDSHAASN